MMDSTRTRIRQHMRCPEYAEVFPTEQVNCNLRLIMRDHRRRNRRYEPGGVEMNFRGYGHCSDHVGETMRVAAVTKPKPSPDQFGGSAQTVDSEHGCPVPVPAPVQDVLAAAELRQRLVAEIQSLEPKPTPGQLEDQLRRLLSNGLPRFRSQLRFRGCRR